MRLRVSGDRNLEIRHLTQASDQFGGARKTFGVRREFARLIGRIAAQGDDVAHAGFPIMLGDLADLGLAGIDAGEMRGGGQASLGDDPRDGAMGPLAGGPARAIGDRDEAGIERRQLLDRGP